MAQVELDVTYNTGQEFQSKTKTVPFHPSELGSACPSTAATDPGFGSAGNTDQSPTSSAHGQSDLSHLSKRLHGKVLEGGFYIKPFLGALSATENVQCHSFMKNT